MKRYLFRALACFLAVGLFCAWSRDLVSDHIRPESEFHKYARIVALKEAPAIRDDVLKRLPLGSSWDALQKFCIKNFKVTKIEKQAASTGPRPSIDKPYVYIEAYSTWRVPESSSHLKLFFVLDDFGNLSEVIIDCDAVSL